MELPDLHGKVAILGIGNRMKGDDAFGSLIAEELQGLENDKLMILDCGMLPENFLSKILEFKPEIILFIDTVEAGEEPGVLKVVELTGENFSGTSTHNISLNAFASLLLNDLDVKIYLIGVQAKQTRFGEEMSGEVSKSKKELVEKLKSIL